MTGFYLGIEWDWTERVSNIEHLPVLPELESKLIFADKESDDRLNKLTSDSLVDTVYGQHIFETTDDVTSGEETIGDAFAPLIVATPSQAGDVVKNVQPDPRNGIPHLYEFNVEDGASSMETDLVLGYRKIINFNSDVYYVNSNGNSIKYDG